MTKEIKIDNAGDLSTYIDVTLGRMSVSIQDAISAAAESVAKEAVKKLKTTSPKGATGVYRKGWKYKMTKVQADGSFSIQIYNAKRGYLTHLLENGHPIISKGQVVRNVAAEPHIAPVNDWIQTEGFRQISEAVQRAINNTPT